MLYSNWVPIKTACGQIPNLAYKSIDMKCVYGRCWDNAYGVRFKLMARHNYRSRSFCLSERFLSGVLPAAGPRPFKLQPSTNARRHELLPSSSRTHLLAFSESTYSLARDIPLVGGETNWNRRCIPAEGSSWLLSAQRLIKSKEVVCKDFTSPGLYPTYVLTSISRLADQDEHNDQTTSPIPSRASSNSIVINTTSDAAPFPSLPSSRHCDLPPQASSTTVSKSSHTNLRPASQYHFPPLWSTRSFNRRCLPSPHHPSGHWWPLRLPIVLLLVLSSLCLVGLFTGPCTFHPLPLRRSVGICIYLIYGARVFGSR